MKKTSALLLAVILLMAWAPAMADEYDGMLAKAEAYCASGDYAKAIAGYQLARRLQPERIEAFLGEANVHILLEDYSAAAAVADAALEVNPISPDAWHLRCRIDILRNDLAAFEQDVVFAQVCESDLSDLYPAAAALYSSAGLDDQAAVYSATTAPAATAEAQQEQPRTEPENSGKEATTDNFDLASAAISSIARRNALAGYTPTLTKAAFPAIASESFEFSDALWEAVDREKAEELLSEIAEGAFSWRSLSPAGNSGILEANDSGISYYEGKYHIIYPSQTRGVADVNGNLAKLFAAARTFKRFPGEEGTVYSPDGRYAALVNNQAVLIQSSFIYDPIIIDLSTGEMILTATYGSKLMRGDTGAVVAAAFSADGQYFYYMLYENMEGYRTALYRYHLQENTTEFCYSGSDLNYHPCLSETAEGAFIILRDTSNENKETGLTRIADEGGVWQGAELSFDLPMKYWRCTRLLHSAKSGYAFIPGKIAAVDASSDYAFQCVRPDEGFAGLNRYYVISKEFPQIQAYTAEELNALFETWEKGTDMKYASAFYVDMPFQAIQAFALSPDGRYALLHTKDYGTRDNPRPSEHLYLVSLEELALREVQGLDPAAVQATKPRKDYEPTIEWNADTLIIGTTDGTQAYELTLPRKP